MQIPAGYRLRPARDEDAADVAQLVNEESRAVLGVPIWAADDLVADWTTPGVEREHDCLVVETGAGAVCGYLIVRAQPPHVEVFSIVAVAVGEREHGLAEWLVAESERRAERFLDRAPEGERVVVHQGALAADPWFAGLLAGVGYEHVRSFDVMRVDFPRCAAAVAALADGVELRPMAVSELERVHAAHEEAFADHWGEGQDSLEEFRHYALDPTHYLPELWLVAWSGDEIAGYLGARRTSREDARRGYVAVLGVRRPYRRRGIAEALLDRAFGTLEELGATGCDLHVDRDSRTGATRLYERVGMTPQPRFTTWEKELRPAAAARAD